MKATPLPSSPPSAEKICSIVVTRNPDSGFRERLDSIADQVAQTVIIDNASEGASVELIGHAGRRDDVLVIENPVNLGLGAAFNQGLAKARELGYPWAITLDQDSRAADDLIREFIRGYSLVSEPERTAVLAPLVHDLGTGEEATYIKRYGGVFFRRRSCVDGVLEGITAVISSGALLRLSAIDEVGGFNEGLFIDYVDTDFCLRLRKAGLEIAAVCDAHLHHRLGRREKRSIGPFTLIPTFHPPWRWYMIGRNRIHMLKEHGADHPHWVTYEMTAAIYTTIRMFLTEDHRLTKARMIIKGTWDGLRGKTGPPSAPVLPEV